MAGTADPKAWDDALKILTQTILLHPPGQIAVDEQQKNAVGLQLLQWAEPLEKPLLLGRTTVFTPNADGTVGVGLGIDVYNASDTTPRGNTLGFARAPRGWDDRAPAAGRADAGDLSGRAVRPRRDGRPGRVRRPSARARDGRLHQRLHPPPRRPPRSRCPSRSPASARATW